MIIKSHEFKTNKSSGNIHLFYGNNEGLKKDLISQNFTNKFEGSIFKYEEREIINSPENFYNNLFTNSFFEEKKLIIIMRVTDKILKIIKDISQKKLENNQIVLLSGLLEKKSKLRNFFEKDKILSCVPFYEDTEVSLSQLARNFFMKKKISISQETINLLTSRCGGDRQNLQNELGKIENYLLNKTKVSLEEISILTNLSENYNVSELIDNCLAKNPYKTAHILNENSYSHEDCMLVLRTLLIKLKRLYHLRNTADTTSIDKAIAEHKPPIFWKEKNIVKKQLSVWKSNELVNQISTVNDIEVIIKKNIGNSFLIISDFLLASSSSNNST